MGSQKIMRQTKLLGKSGHALSDVTIYSDKKWVKKV